MSFADVVAVGVPVAGALGYGAVARGVCAFHAVSNLLAMATGERTRHLFFDTQRTQYHVLDGGMLRLVPAAAVRFFDVENKDQIGDYDRAPMDQGPPLPDDMETFVVDGHTFYIKDRGSKNDASRCWRLVDGPARACLAMLAAAAAPGVPRNATLAASFGSHDFWEDLPAHTVAVYGNERWYPVKGWTTKMLPTDRPQVSLRNGAKPHVEFGAFGIPPDGWTWVQPQWQVVVDGTTDDDGWVYAIDFPRRFSAHCAKTDCVRRRLFQRTVQRGSAQAAVPGAQPATAVATPAAVGANSASLIGAVRPRR
jgi:hypothetical protein